MGESTDVGRWVVWTSFFGDVLAGTVIPSYCSRLKGGLVLRGRDY